MLKDFKLSDNTKRLNKTDWIIMGIMVIVYGILSFIRLGDTVAPNTYKTFDYYDEEIITLDKEHEIGIMRYYTGNNLGEFSIFSSIDGKDYKEETSIKIDSVFTWQDISLYTNAKYIKFVANSNLATLGDIAFYDYDDVIIPMKVDKDNPLLDEIKLVPEEINFMNSSYFDEIYYARTVYEYLHGIDVYEWTHPPLGKLIMAIPVAIFGFNPFSYRLMGNIFGILLIPIMYIFAKRVFKNRKWALLAGLIMMFDNFHFAHTRIALIDGFQVAFIILSVLFMKEYIDLNKKDSFKKKALYLLLSGFFIGCAIDTKWNALYVGLGLAITFFIHLFKQYNITKYFKKISIDKLLKGLSVFILMPALLYFLGLIFGINNCFKTVLIYYGFIGIILLSKLAIFSYHDKYLMKLFIVAVISFIIIPLVIYILSYVLFPNVSYYDGTVKGILDMTDMMYGYHSNLVATHPFSSVWYEWPIMANPVWLYTGNTLNGLKMTISDIGNPAIWWVGIIGALYLVIDSIKNKNKNSIFILVFILSTFIPYIFIGRLMFMYHYFITLPFIMLGIVSFIKWITEKTKNNRIYYGYIILIVITFFVFYPIVSGMPISDDYVESLKWLSHWYF